jgi:ABC-type branched-subunit amino acid transport system ATPase component
VTTTNGSTPLPSRVVGVNDLSYSYGSLRALEHVSLSVESGQICCVLGPNGAGKSTLGAVIAGALLSPPGTVFLDGEDISQEPLHQRARRGMAYAPEGGAVFPALTVSENLCLGMKSLSRAKRNDVVDQASQFFPFLAKRRGTRAGMLSGGEQQMLSLARILVAQPKVAVVDELSHGLAPAIVEQLFETLAAAKGRTTFVLIEQYLGRAYGLADLILVLSQGDPVHWGPAADTSIEDLERLYRLDESDV